MTAAVNVILGQVSRTERNPHRKRRSVVDAALDLDRASMELDQLFDQRKADTGAFDAAAFRSWNAVKPLENEIQLVFANAGAGVLDAQNCARDRRRFFAHADGDAALEREFERIAQQIEDDFLPHVAIDVGLL